VHGATKEPLRVAAERAKKRGERSCIAESPASRSMSGSSRRRSTT
jgi:hypothetical protein